ncbi:MAG TPA: histidine--tRNA ligase [Patescibacteria group bacterium]|nr:histidine--tRNA ligase [Patescibacteria group bacterium]
MIEPKTLKGFRDFLPREARKRQYVIDTLKKVFESYGFEPLETPTLELDEILTGKYGEEGEQLMYRFEDKGGRKVAMRYDQTVPLARVIAQYEGKLTLPFKRYQISNVWRGENTQAGRYREFLQCDADIIGSPSSVADAETLALVLDIYSTLGLDVQIKINDRANFEGLDKKYVSAIDKLDKIGEEGVISELIQKGMSESDAKAALSKLQNTFLTARIHKILADLKAMGKDVGRVNYIPTLARGLDYYTGMIFETVAEGSTGSICSGGRWDEMIGVFTGKRYPAVGFGLGFDRTVEVLERKNLIPDLTAKTQVLVTIFSSDLLQKSLETVASIREAGIEAEIYLDEGAKMEKQIKYANTKQIPYVVIVGPKEVEDKTITVKNLATGEQKTVSLENLPQIIE